MDRVLICAPHGQSISHSCDTLRKLSILKKPKAGRLTYILIQWYNLAHSCLYQKNASEFQVIRQALGHPPMLF